MATSAQWDALARAADRVREWVDGRLDDDSLDIARLYKSSRDTLLLRLRRVYEDKLALEPTLVHARRTGAAYEINQIVEETANDLTDYLGRNAVEAVTTLLADQPRVLNREYRRYIGADFEELPYLSQRVMDELTTSVVGGGTFFDHVLNWTDKLRRDVHGNVRTALVNGQTFDQLRNNLLRTFGVEKLREPSYNAYGAVKVYKNAARAEWNKLVQQTAREHGALEVWWAVLDEDTTPGCAANHGRAINEIGQLPPRHINCVLPETTIEGAFVAGLRTSYRGMAVCLQTAQGRTLSVTANHPVLTMRGFVRAAKIREGDRLVCRREGVEHLCAVDNEEHGPASAQQIFETLRPAGRLRRASLIADDLYGDAAFGDGEIETVVAHTELRNGFEAAPSQRACKSRFLLTAPSTLAMGRETTFNRAPRVLLAASSSPRSAQLPLDGAPVVLSFPSTSPLQSLRFGRTARLDAALIETTRDYLSRCSETHGEREDRLPTTESLDQTVNVERDAVALPSALTCGGSDFSSPWFAVRESPGIPPTAQLDIRFLESLVDRPRVAAEFARDVARRHSVLVELDEVIRVERFHYDGSVFDFESTTGLMIAEGIVTKQCRCTVAVMPAEIPLLQFRQAGDAWLAANGYSRRQAAAMESSGWPWGQTSLRPLLLVEDADARYGYASVPYHALPAIMRNGVRCTEHWLEVVHALGRPDHVLLRDDGRVRTWTGWRPLRSESTARLAETFRGDVPDAPDAPMYDERRVRVPRDVWERFPALRTATVPAAPSYDAAVMSETTALDVASDSLEEAWDERLHPRGTGGRFAVASGTSFHRGVVQPPSPEERALLDDVANDPAVQKARLEIVNAPQTRMMYQQPDGSYEPERAALHEQIVAEMLNPHAASVLGERPTVSILLGIPASGKSKVLRPLVEKLGRSTVIDADHVKERLPEYNGTNAATVHAESADVAEHNLLRAAIDRGHNIVVDWTGKNTEKSVRTMRKFADLGYDVDIYHVTIPPLKAAQRALERFHEERRFVDPSYIINEVGHRADATYLALKATGLARRWVSYDNDVPRGAPPQVLDAGIRTRRESGPGRLPGVRPGEDARPAAQGASFAEAVREAVAEWDERLHPRGAGGLFIGVASGTSRIEFHTPTPEAFIEARDKSKHPEFLSPLAPEDLHDRRLFMNAEGTVGFALDPDGDIENVFNNSGTRGFGVDAMFTAIVHGGRVLDCFDKYLPNYYTQFGFVETGRVKFDPQQKPPKWDMEKLDSPDVVFMRWTGYHEHPDAIRARVADEGTWHADQISTQRFDSWNAAKADSKAQVRTYAHVVRAESDRRRREESRTRGRGEARGSDPGASGVPRDAALVISSERALTVLRLHDGRTLYHRPTFNEALTAPYDRVAVVCKQDGLVWSIRPANSPAFVLPGGHIEDGESMRAAAEREFREETGVTCRVTGSVGILYRSWSTTHVFTAEYVSGPDLVDTPEEISAVALVLVDQLARDEALWLAKHLRESVWEPDRHPRDSKGQFADDDERMTDKFSRRETPRQRRARIKQMKVDPERAAVIKRALGREAGRAGEPDATAHLGGLWDSSKHPRDEQRRFTSEAFDAAKHPRVPAGASTGGEFSTTGGPHITRDGAGRWRTHEGKLVLDDTTRDRINSLKIPPAWSNVRVSTDPDRDLQVTGIDAKGRTQYIYSAEHSERAAAEKFERLKAFNQQIEGIRGTVAADLANPNLPENEREAAAALRLIDKTGFRVGSDAETGGAVKAYGATTLLTKHVTIRGDAVSFAFTGKKGVHITKTLHDAELARDLAARKRVAGRGGRLFDTTDASVRDYLHSRDGEFKVKDFRTWHGTTRALEEIAKLDPPTSASAFKKAQLAVSKAVAEHLGNTPAVARASYIDPAVWSPWKAKLGNLAPATKVGR